MVYAVIDFLRRAINKVFIERGMKQNLKRCGRNVKIGANSEMKPLNRISIDDNSEVGPRALFWTTRANITIGKDVILGPGVTIITGDHPTSIIGRKIRSITDEEKPEECDQDVIIDDDVWIGCNATILKGVHIRRGSIVAAGSLVVKDVPPYCIVGGVPAKVIKYRFSEEELKQHIKMVERENE